MKQFNLLFFVAILILSSCTTNYYLAVSDTETPVYSTVNGIDQPTSIEAGKAFLYLGNSNNTSIKYGSVTGYSAKSTTWKRLKKLSKKQVDHLSFTTDYGYVYDGISVTLYQYGRLIKNTPSSRSSGSTTRSSTSSGGTVHVKGYTRKDGTYVSPHTRSAPRRH